MISFVMLCALVAAPRLPLVFLSQDDLLKPSGVTVEAQSPTPGVTLFAKPFKSPTLWIAPVAAIAENGATRIWYQRVDKSEEEYSDQRTLCVGELRGDAWTLPALDILPDSWAGPNNVCMRRSPHKPTWGGFNVFQIVRDAEYYRMLYWDQPEPPKEAGAMLATSKDGAHWEKDSRGTVFIEHNDAYSLLRKDDGFVLYQTALEPWPDKPYPDNIDKFKRVLSIRTSPDLITWTPQEIFLRPDKDDAPETEFYLMKTFAYAQGYAALIMKYYADPKMPNKHSATMKYELVVSENARDWKRPYREKNLEFWTYADPFENNGRMHFVAWKDSELKTVAYRLRGLTAVRALEKGRFITGPFLLPEHGIALNADVLRGSIEVQLLDEQGNRIPGIEHVQVDNANDVKIPVPFDAAAVKNIIGQPCRLQVTIDEASLYSVEPMP